MRRPAWLRDPLAPGLLLFTGLVLGGFASIAMGWRIAARTRIVAVQLPAAVSGAFVGLALVATGAYLATVQVGRRLAAIERAETDAVLGEAAVLAVALSERVEG